MIHMSSEKGTVHNPNDNDLLEKGGGCPFFEGIYSVIYKIKF